MTIRAAENTLETILLTSPLPRLPTEQEIVRFGKPPLSFFDIMAASGIEVVEADTLTRLGRHLFRRRGHRTIAFVYNIRAFDLCAIALYGRRLPFVLYYQNKWPNRMTRIKRIATEMALRRARLVLLQDRICLDHFGPQLGKNRVMHFPWTVDDSFFDPAICPSSRRSDFIFVPGDRNRLDRVVIEIARRTGRKILRVARHFSDESMEAYAKCPNVELRYFVRWEELRRLYAEAAVVLNVSDDSETAAGTTSFLEGLAMNALVITPRMHSSAGFEFSDGHKPYLTVDDPFSADAWIGALEKADSMAAQWPPERLPRSLITQLSGNVAVSRRWREVLLEASIPAKPA